MFTHNIQELKGRGVAVYVNSKLTALESFKDIFNHIEVISVKIKLKKKKKKKKKRNNDWLLFHGEYRIPNSAIESLRELNTVLSRERDNQHRYSQIVADYISREINWDTEITSVGENQQATIFLELVRVFFTSAREKSYKIPWQWNPMNFR